MISNQKKVKCWSFILTSFTDNDINRLSNLPPDLFSYVTFSVCGDDTGNRFLQGFVRTHKRCYKSLLYRTVGENVIHDIPGRNEDLYYVLTIIHLGQSLKEFGIPTKSRFEGHLKELKEFKSSVFHGITASDELMKRFPKICLQFPNLVVKHTHAASVKPEIANISTPEDHKRWFDAWKEGKMYQVKHN